MSPRLGETIYTVTGRVTVAPHHPFLPWSKKRWAAYISLDPCGVWDNCTTRVYAETKSEAAINGAALMGILVAKRQAQVPRVVAAT